MNYPQPIYFPPSFPPVSCMVSNQFYQGQACAPQVFGDFLSDDYDEVILNQKKHIKKMNSDFFLLINRNL